MDVVKAMVDRTWRGLLSAISQLLQRSSSEEIVLQLLKVGKFGCYLTCKTAVLLIGESWL